MLKFLLLAIGLVFSTLSLADTPAPAPAPAVGNLSLGVGLGLSGAGISASAPVDANSAVQGLLGVTYGEHLLLNLDYAFSAPLAKHLKAYAGPGLTVHNDLWGPRIPVGLEFDPASKGLQLGAELAPTVLFGHGWTYSYLDALIYARVLLK